MSSVADGDPRPAFGTDEAHAYWRDPDADPDDIRTVGNRNCSRALNRWIYRRKQRVVRAVAAAPATVPDAAVFEGGFGNGLYLPIWWHLGFTHVAGVDLSEHAVAHCRRRFPDHDLRAGDLADGIDTTRRFDLVTAIDVLYHVLDDDDWASALRNLAELVSPGGLLVVTDRFAPARETDHRHVRRRSWDDYLAVLGSCGLRPRERRTFTRFLGSTGRDWVALTWRVAHFVDSRAERVGLGALSGTVLGAALYLADTLSPRSSGRGKALELAVFERVATR